MFRKQQMKVCSWKLLPGNVTENTSQCVIAIWEVQSRALKLRNELSYEPIPVYGHSIERWLVSGVVLDYWTERQVMVNHGGIRKCGSHSRKNIGQDGHWWRKSEGLPRTDEGLSRNAADLPRSEGGLLQERRRPVWIEMSFTQRRWRR
jgi:hypothetical protein